MNVFFCVTVPQARLTGTPDRGRLRTTLCIIKKEKNYNNFPKKKGGKKNASRLDDPFVVDVASTCLSSEEVSMEMTPPPTPFFSGPVVYMDKCPPPPPSPLPHQSLCEKKHMNTKHGVYTVMSLPPPPPPPLPFLGDSGTMVNFAVMIPSGSFRTSPLLPSIFCTIVLVLFICLCQSRQCSPVCCPESLRHLFEVEGCCWMH